MKKFFPMPLPLLVNVAVVAMEGGWLFVTFKG
jgi:hypothetical protein